ncbi:MAG: hypothetical protein ACP5KZ_09575, partial [bacterium]
GQTIELSPAQMEETKGGLFRDCNKQFNCLGHDAGCYKSGNPIEAAYVWYLPFLHWECGWAFTIKGCTNYQGYVYCGKVKGYDNPDCGGVPQHEEEKYEYHDYCAL